MGSYIEILNQGRRKARKDHQCYDCYRPIRRGDLHSFGTYKYDDVYTIRHHIDCMEASEFYRKSHDFSYYDFCDGIPPLADMISDAGERELDYNLLRGHYPHVVCRMEYSKQVSDIKWENME
jgi:hypothetical protein